MNTETIETIEQNIKTFIKGQTNVFNTIVGEIVPGVTAENLDAPVQRPFNHKSACSRAYFLYASGGTGKLLLCMPYSLF